MSANTLEFGIGLSRPEDVAANAREAELLGYDYVVTGEHVFFYGPINNGLITLAAAAGATQRIKLMSTITLVPLYPAALLAKQVASLDVVSNGRFNLGVGVGGEFAREFEACGVPVNERGARTNESLELMQRLFTEQDVTFEGRFSTLDKLTLDPRPVQTPLPTWISGRSAAAITRCAKYGTGWLPYMYTPQQLSDSVQAIADQAMQHGRTDPIRSGLFIFFCVHEDHDTGVAMAAKRLSRQYNQDFSELVHKYAIAGNPEHCVARLQEYVQSGAQTVILNSACPSGYLETNEALMAQAVLPQLRQT